MTDTEQLKTNSNYVPHFFWKNLRLEWGIFGRVLPITLWQHT